MKVIMLAVFYTYVGFMIGQYYTESTDDLILQKQDVKTQLKKLKRESRILEKHVNRYVDISHCISKEKK